MKENPLENIVSHTLCTASKRKLGTISREGTKKMFCGQCGEVLGEGYDYCPNCGDDVTSYNNPEARAAAPQVFCMYCGQIINAGEEYCNQCGTRIGEVQPAEW